MAWIKIEVSLFKEVSVDEAILTDSKIQRLGDDIADSVDMEWSTIDLTILDDDGRVIEVE